MVGNTDISHWALMNMEQSNYGWKAVSPFPTCGCTDFGSLSGEVNEKTAGRRYVGGDIGRQL